VEENTELHTPMVSRLVHLVLGDALAVAAALLSPPAAEERLARMKAAVRARRIEPEAARREPEALRRVGG